MHLTTSKLRIFFFLLPFITIPLSCSREENDVIPDVFVSFYADLVYDPYFFDLASSIGTSVTISASTNNWGSSAAGFDGNGIIIYHALPDEYYAFDRTCPHCYAVDAVSRAVNPDMIYAVCPRCTTTYALSSFGTPLSGPGQYPLKNYRTALSGVYLHVWNNN